MTRVVALVLLTVCHALLVCAQSTEQSTLTPDQGEQHSIDKLRAIAEAIKNCPPLELSSGIDPSAEKGFENVQGPPLNVVWNVELHPSIRARYEGSIEFIEPSYYKLPPDDNYCNKPKINKSDCRRRWMMGTQIYKRQMNHPLQFIFGDTHRVSRDRSDC
jgi:hypothetical protein